MKCTEKETDTDEHINSEESIEFIADVTCDGTQTPVLKTTETCTKAGLITSEASTKIVSITSDASTKIDPITSEPSTQIDPVTSEAATQTDSR